MFNKETEKEEVYSSTNLSDLLSSPVFYSVIALAFILGVSSIFGFFNNPRKLKTVVDVISQKLLISPNSNTASFNANAEYLRQKYLLKVATNASANNEKEMLLTVISNPYNILSGFSGASTISKIETTNKNFQRVSFDYDITSKQFWSDFDASQIESMIEESQRQNGNSLIIGTPLSSDYSLEQGDEKYSMNAGLLRL